jgi:hypothetical protein
VNSRVSCTITTSVCYYFFLATSFLEFPTKRFLVTCARETLINEWDARGTEISEGVHSVGWAGQEEESWWKIRIAVGEYQWVVGFLSCEWTMRDHLLWITSLSSGVTCC